MIILGIDPGSRITGYGVIEWGNHKAKYIDSGCIRMDVKATTGNRLKTIFEGLDQLIGLYQPDVLSIEQVFVYKNPQSAIKLGQARGVVMCAAALANIEIHEYTPTRIKQTVVGNGHATKEQVQHMVEHLLKLSRKPQADAADALAIALTHGFHGPVLGVK